ncbi:MAG: NAD(P)/FAD-dependent oxidoreductase [Gammaproteobacteria bacterium]|nr:NAD(P)/FAD-dependent oxidoreductase [Gammaproteobacteria bacterium]
MDHVECIVIGAGVIGLAVASRLAVQGYEVVVLERHNLIGSETSSRNSEVIHAGIYYPKNSLKAQLCVQGKQQLYEYCEQYRIGYQRCGKIIVAADEHQIGPVRGYLTKAMENGVDDLVWLEKAQVLELEPDLNTVGAVLSPSTGVIDSHAFMLSLQGELEKHGGMLALESSVSSIEPGAKPVVHTEDISISTDWVINCAGLSAPQLAVQDRVSYTAHFAKGHYYAYSGKQPFSRLVYPVAQAGGLGVHVTLGLAGQVKFGPDVRWIDKIDYSFDESHFKDFVAAISSYYPGVDPRRLHPSYTGIRPKLAPAGVGFQDFVINGPQQHGVAGRIDLLGIESPGLTASLAIADTVVSYVRHSL